MIYDFQMFYLIKNISPNTNLLDILKEKIVNDVKRYNLDQ